jgi:hypothetical protein
MCFALESITMVKTRYGFNFTDEAVSKDIHRLTNQIWKLIPMRENNENWGIQLEKVLVELVGLNSIFYYSDKYLELLSNLEGLKITELDFTEYRSKVFESISLLREINNVKD